MQGSKSFNTNYRDVFLLRLQFEKDTIVRGVGLPVCPFLSPVAAAVACRRKDEGGTPTDRAGPPTSEGLL